MHGLVMLDEARQVIRPSLIWCDQRSQPQVDFVNARVGREKVLRVHRNPVLTGFTLPKLLWVRDNEPANFDRVRKMLLPKDYVRFRLTGEFATEVSDASGTSAVRRGQAALVCEMMDALGLDRDILPALLRIERRHRPHLRRRWPNSPASPPVRRWWAAAATRRPARSATASWRRASSPAPSAPPASSSRTWTRWPTIPPGRVHTFCHAVRDKWHVMGVTQGAGLSLQWFRNQLAPRRPNTTRSPREAAHSPAGCARPVLAALPDGRAHPAPRRHHPRRLGRADGQHTRADLIRAVIEGVSYSQRDCLDIVEGLGVPVSIGARLGRRSARARSGADCWPSIFNKRVVTLETQEGSAYGAALLALVGTGEYASVPEVCRAAIRETASVSPNAADAPFYAKAHRVYQSLYPALRPACAAIAAAG